MQTRCSSPMKTMQEFKFFAFVNIFVQTRIERKNCFEHRTMKKRSKGCVKSISICEIYQKIRNLSEDHLSEDNHRRWDALKLLETTQRQIRHGKIKSPKALPQPDGQNQVRCPLQKPPTLPTAWTEAEENPRTESSSSTRPHGWKSISISIPRGGNKLRMPSKKISSN